MPQYSDINMEDRLDDVLDELNKESDRAAAILLGVELDDLLLAILEKYLLRRKKIGIDLLEPDSPLGSFASRIEVLYRFGIISEYLYRELHLIRRIRNAFAHKPAGMSFEMSPAKDYAFELSFPNHIVKETKRDMDARSRYTTSGALLLLALTTTFQTIQPVKEQDIEFDITDIETRDPGLIEKLSKKFIALVNKNKS